MSAGVAPRSGAEAWGVLTNEMNGAYPERVLLFLSGGCRGNGMRKRNREALAAEQAKLTERGALCGISRRVLST